VVRGFIGVVGMATDSFNNVAAKKRTNLIKSFRTQNPPNPKNRVTRIKEPRPFMKFAANFSLDFADWAICNYADEEEFILDPFCGSATTLLSSQSYGIKSAGIELNPVWVIYGRGRLIMDSKKVRNEIASLLRESNSVSGEIKNEWLEEFFGAILTNKERTCLGGRDLFAAAVLCCARKELNPIYGMNHSWPMITTEKEIHFSRKELSSMLQQMLAHSGWVKQNYPCLVKPNVSLGDARTLDLNQKASLVVTSPPYLSRLDYIRSSLPEITFLETIGAVEDANILRKKQIGTVIVKESEYIKRISSLPKGSRDLIANIETHPSKGSKSYYSKFVANYLNSMQIVFKSLSSTVTQSARFIMVVQDSWYKDIQMKTSSLLTEMLLELGWKIECEWNFAVESSLSSMNPHSRDWRDSSKISENVIALRRSRNAS